MIRKKKDIEKNEDFHLWERFKKGDQQALREIYSKYYNTLFSYGKKLSKDQSIVEDCIQELFMLLIDKAKKIASTDNIKFYLIASYRNNLIKKIKSEQHEEFSENKVIDDYFDYQISTEQRIIESELVSENKENLQQMMNRLAPRQKEAIYLKFFLDLSYEEITSVMDVNYQSARKLVYTSVKSLREFNEQNLETLESPVLNRI